MDDFLGDVLNSSVFTASSNASKAKSSRIFSVLGAMVVVFVFVLVPAIPVSLSLGLFGNGPGEERLLVMLENVKGGAC